MPPARWKRRHGILRSYLGSSEERKHFPFLISHFSFFIFHLRSANSISGLNLEAQQKYQEYRTERVAPLEQMWSASTLRHYKHSITVPGALATAFN